jgi:hypothetical protein
MGSPVNNLEFLTKREIAEALKFRSMRSVDKVLREIPHLKINGRGKVLIARIDFERWLKRHEVVPELKNVRGGLAGLLEKAKKKALAAEVKR